MIMNKQQQDYYSKLYLLSRKNKSIGQSIKWLDDNYTGDTRKAIKHQMYVESWETTVELELLKLLKQLYKGEC